MGKNVCLGRYFFQLPPESKGKGATSTKSRDAAAETIDVWPSNLLSTGGNQSYADVCSLFLLQMACVLNMAAGWRRARLRIFLCVESDSGDQGWLAKEERFRELLGKLRIRATIKIVPWDSAVRLLRGSDSGSVVTEEFLSAVNQLLKEHSTSAAVRFLYLPRPPADSNQSQQYLAQLDTLTQGLGPTLLIHGLTPVTCTEL
ncbi:Solute carrier family 12 member 9 [Bagarius yarrelli]|uniref:Solute carrier family 12 member 9 n=1 Tax=Bagarius yarrelli TaxID=175774 RepID=A0A556VU76_BAGYA|nr:Solute carrier family 12 member 9 [Bagarius yarrelli]